MYTLSGRRPGLPVLLLLALIACAPRPGPERFGDRPDSQVLLTVRNRNWSDITIFATRGSSRTRLGLVVSLQESSFPVPTEMVRGGGNLVLVAEPIGDARGVHSPPVQAAAGQTIVWTLEPNLVHSRLAVWDR